MKIVVTEPSRIVDAFHQCVHNIEKNGYKDEYLNEISSNLNNQSIEAIVNQAVNELEDAHLSRPQLYQLSADIQIIQEASSKEGVLGKMVNKIIHLWKKFAGTLSNTEISTREKLEPLKAAIKNELIISSIQTPENSRLANSSSELLDFLEFYAPLESERLQNRLKKELIETQNPKDLYMDLLNYLYLELNKHFPDVLNATSVLADQLPELANQNNFDTSEILKDNLRFINKLISDDNVGLKEDMVDQYVDDIIARFGEKQNIALQNRKNYAQALIQKQIRKIERQEEALALRKEKNICKRLIDAIPEADKEHAELTELYEKLNQVKTKEDLEIVQRQIREKFDPYAKKKMIVFYNETASGNKHPKGPGQPEDPGKKVVRDLSIKAEAKEFAARFCKESNPRKKVLMFIDFKNECCSRYAGNEFRMDDVFPIMSVVVTSTEDPEFLRNLMTLDVESISLTPGRSFPKNYAVNYYRETMNIFFNACVTAGSVSKIILHNL